MCPYCVLDPVSGSTSCNRLQATALSLQPFPAGPAIGHCEILGAREKKVEIDLEEGGCVHLTLPEARGVRKRR